MLNFKIFKSKGEKKQEKPSQSEPVNLENIVSKAQELRPTFGNSSTRQEFVDDSDGMKNFITVSKTGYEDYGVYAGIMRDPTAKGGKRYMIMEPSLTPQDKENFEKIRKMLMVELSIDLNDIQSRADAEERLKKKIVSMIDKYGLDIKRRNFSKIFYYAIRDFTRFGIIDPVMHDHMIEEISCDGTNIPLYIWHREYESMPTNILFHSDAELENFVRKLAYVSGKHISVANPIVDATLPDGSRINLTLGHEVTKRGSTFTIRHFKEDPITIIDLIRSNTVSSDIAAYLWFLVENKLTMLISGGTASGKTTTLNAIASFITPSNKIVSIEDTPELNLPHENWIPSISRQTFTAGGVGEISQFDLLRAALRQRPDIIIVGETRGREAHTLFQAMATGHGGFSSIHADSVKSCITRLTSVPMEVPKVLLVTTLNAILLQLKIRIGDKSVRRVMQISEIVGYDEKSEEILLSDVFKWNPETDKHEFSGKSIMFDKIAQRIGLTKEQVTQELSKRKTALEWMLASRDIQNAKDVNATIMEFYSNPERFYERKRFLT
ncbi:MAG TPA: type II/IV secretion system ATPase subunit [Nitrosopumilaceae archaeon]|nr:type II/IV secretion system ATPase subunit [Nitrosopumilaceae archaeon]